MLTRSIPIRAAFAVGLLLALSVPARAQEATGQVSGALSVGYSDNILSAPRNTPPGSVGPQGSGFLEASPGAAFFYNTPRVSNILRYVFTGTAALQEQSATSIANTLVYTGSFETSPRTALALGLSATHGRVHDINAAQSAAQTSVEVAPADVTTYYFQAGASEGFSYDLTERVAVGETLTYLAYFPLEANTVRPRVYNIGGSIYGDHAWRDDTLRIALGVAYTQFAAHDLPQPAPPAPPIPGLIEPARHDLVNTLTATWSHDYSDHWSHQVTAGVLEAMRATDFGGRLWQPTGRVGVLYNRDEWQAEIAYMHTAQPNVFLGELVLIDQATLRVDLPLAASERSVLALSGASGINLSRPIDQNGDIGPTTTLFIGDAALSWSPLNLSFDYSAAIRYQHARQGDQGPVSGYTRNTVLFTMAAAFPNRAATEPSVRPAYRTNRPGEQRPRERRQDTQNGQPAATP